MRVLVFTPIAALTLAACGGSDVSVTNASPEEVAAKVDAAGGARFNPGEWETTVETVSVDIPGLEGPMKDEMARIMLQKKQVGKIASPPNRPNRPPPRYWRRARVAAPMRRSTWPAGRSTGRWCATPRAAR